MISFRENRTLVANVTTKDNASFDLTDFLSLFVQDGCFSDIADNIFGIIPINSQAKSYSISFKVGSTPSVIGKLLANFGSGQNIQTPSHRMITITFSRPKPPPQTVTLWPVSHEISGEILKNLVEGNKWGKLVRFAFGRHKNFPQFHNAYLHLQIDGYEPNNIPDKILINNASTMVLKPGESNIPRCNFCKTKGHVIANCPAKQKNNTGSNKPSYSGAVMHTNPKSGPVTPHPKTYVLPDPNVIPSSINERPPLPSQLENLPETATESDEQIEKGEISSDHGSPTLPKHLQENKDFSTPVHAGDEKEITTNKNTENQLSFYAETTPSSPLTQTNPQTALLEPLDTAKSIFDDTSSDVSDNPSDPGDDTIFTLIQSSKSTKRKNKRTKQDASPSGITPPAKQKHNQTNFPGKAQTKHMN